MISKFTKPRLDVKGIWKLQACVVTPTNTIFGRTTTIKVDNIDSGIEIILDTGVDISNSTAVGILYVKPDGTRGNWPGAVKGRTKISCGPRDISKIREAAELLILRGSL